MARPVPTEEIARGGKWAVRRRHATPARPTTSLGLLARIVRVRPVRRRAMAAVGRNHPMVVVVPMDSSLRRQMAEWAQGQTVGVRPDRRRKVVVVEPATLMTANRPSPMIRRCGSW
jgi:hypothetical protein